VNISVDEPVICRQETVERRPKSEIRILFFASFAVLEKLSNPCQSVQLNVGEKMD
jgi:hypothetical protein